jgi:hypothetical protein
MATEAGKERIMRMIEDRLVRGVAERNPDMRRYADESIKDFVERFIYRSVIEPEKKASSIKGLIDA